MRRREFLLQSSSLFFFGILLIYPTIIPKWLNDDDWCPVLGCVASQSVIPSGISVNIFFLAGSSLSTLRKLFNILFQRLIHCCCVLTHEKEKTVFNNSIQRIFFSPFHFIPFFSFFLYDCLTFRPKHNDVTGDF